MKNLLLFLTVFLIASCGKEEIVTKGNWIRYPAEVQKTFSLDQDNNRYYNVLVEVEFWCEGREELCVRQEDKNKIPGALYLVLGDTIEYDSRYGYFNR